MKKILICIPLMLIVGSSNAALIKTGLQLVDDSSGLSWLDLSYTTDLNYLQIQETLSDSSSYVGENQFRLATESEVTDLFSQFFPSLPYNQGSYGRYYTEDLNSIYTEQITKFVSLMGDTVPSDPHIAASGFFLSDDSYVELNGVYSSTLEGNTTNLIFDSEYAPNYGETYSSIGAGWYLVRDLSLPHVEVSEPSTIFLMGLGFLGIIANRKRKTPK
ncbi:PEP-CTERM sorting domain-containing protein [Saccharospirillum alexandrii]|uniref:PEP-CTERM sorting domain-containing protein n=1 Tax=Saccharospirillum alexandrii TaxID=2448477 RepID=UPI003735D8EA